MTIQTEPYAVYTKKQPNEGQHILAYQSNDQIVVYQAYNHQIANYAIQHQQFGGTHYSYNRMSWIKPNFLWMMYRCGWASKENQERVLAIWIDKADFDKILEQAVFSSFNAAYYNSHNDWQKEMAEKEVRLQWDPDHDPYGQKLTRRAIQLGMKGRILENFGKYQVRKIEDITDFVKEQKTLIDSKALDQLVVPIENIHKPVSESLCNKSGIQINA